MTAVESVTRESIQTRNGVTAAEYLASATFASRNAPTFDMEAWRQRRQRHNQAMRLGKSCGLCGREFTRTETLWRASAYNDGGPFDPRWWVTVLCETCRPADHRWFKLHPCETCGRSVQIEQSKRRYRHVFCCHRCGSRWHNHQRNQRARQARERTCVICAQEFVGTRSDALTCSPKCRQKAYRLRVQAKEDRPDTQKRPPGPARVGAANQPTDRQSQGRTYTHGPTAPR